MKLISLILAGAAVTSVSVPAAANWQYTEWGMDAAQVIHASGGAVHASSRPQILEGIYNGGGRSYAATFYFRNGALAKVDLKLNGAAACDDVPADLVRIYGGANRKEAGNYGFGVAEWLDDANGNDVVLTYLVKTCTVTYAPLATANSLGL